MRREWAGRLKPGGWRAAGGWALLSLFLTFLGAGPVEADAVRPRVELDRQAVLVGEKRPVFVLVDFEVAQAPQRAAQARPRVNLALVLDRSGSMAAQGKMEYAKKAAKFVVDRLEPTDRLAVVEYDDRITLLWPSSPVESPRMIKRLIDGLQPRGSTNLTGGMMQGVEQVRAHLGADRINRVILLSDGLANTGVTHPLQIAGLVRAARAGGVTLSTMGLGLQYNEDLMQAIAQDGGGRYYYIESPTQLVRIFEREMSTLFATVAKAVRVGFSGGEAVEKVEVFGYPAEIAGRNAVVPMENFYSGEKRVLLLRLTVKAGKEGEIPLGRIDLSYLDTTDNRPKAVSAELKVTASSSPQVVTASLNKGVVAEAALVEADQRHEEYVKLYQQGKRQEAKAGLDGLAKALAARNAGLSDVRLGKKVEALRLEAEEMDKAAASAQARSAYAKAAKQRLYLSQKGQRGMYILKEGDTGYEVERLQAALKTEGLYKGPVDGKFGPEVAAAVREFQQRSQLAVDGVAGPRTMQALKLY